MDPREWFDEDTYSDLTIKLSNGEEVKVHKVIVCRLNEYFDKLCGPESHFAESKQSTIELKDDDPVALTNVLRYIYDLPIEEDFSSTPAWRFWLNLYTTADKYLEPRLKRDADRKFRIAAVTRTDADEIFDIIETLKSEMAHDDALTDLAESMRKNNFGKLLRNEAYRAKLDSGGKEVLWQVVDELAFATRLKRKRYFLCDSHAKRVFPEPRADQQPEEPCNLCHDPNGYYHPKHPRQRGRVAWVGMEGEITERT